ncbi:MAG: FKBP-type peptidyl-prolyl cis-trans isomerase [Desulfobacteraceae bacterium]|jgi:FKBP-type peptidyl-prolyl cis-trans isomerase
MKKHLLAAVLIIPFLFMIGCSKQDVEKVSELKTPAEKLGYSLGSDIGKSFKKNEMDIDKNAFVQGFLDGLSEAKPLLSPEETRSIQQTAIMDMRKKLSEKRQVASGQNKKDGDAFLVENAKKEGVKTTPSGLQYEILTEGKGPIPKDTDRVQVNYSGKLLDGTEFDSSFQRGKPSTFSVKGVIPGWTEALLMMPVGSKWRIVVPSELAYKDHGAGQKIGPNATLIFEIELVAIGDSPTDSGVGPTGPGAAAPMMPAPAPAPAKP